MYLKSQQDSNHGFSVDSLFAVEVPNLRKLARSAMRTDRDLAKNLEQDYDAMFARVLARNPDLVPTWKSVPDEKNGFLQWLEFCEKRSPGEDVTSVDLTLDDELSDMINGLSEWDREMVKKHLDAHSDLLDEVTRIGIIDDQSTSGVAVDRWVWFSANFTKQCADLLCADARVAAEEGDAERAELRINAALGLAKHHSQIETPSLMSETVAILIQISVLGASVEHVIPALDLSPGEIRQWRDTLKPVTNEDFSEVMRGEFYASTRGMLIPILLSYNSRSSEVKISDPEVLCDAFAQNYLHQMSQIRAANPQKLYQNTAGLHEDFTPTSQLSKEAQTVYDDSRLGVSVWGKGFTRAQAIYRYHDAALAIAVGDKPPADLITGKPFLFDPQTRVISFPDDPMLKELAVGPIKVP